MDSNAPLFLSYSRKDYYFAESVAFHLIKRGVPSWLDVKDLTPGEYWERDLQAALDRAPCVVLIASPESLKSPHVRTEIERARAQGKRIVAAWFRGSDRAVLQGCEWIDFRRPFAPALDELIALLAGK